MVIPVRVPTDLGVSYARGLPADLPNRTAANSSFGRCYLPLIRRLIAARWRGTPMHGELDDAVQEVFIECLKPDGPLSRVDAARGSVSGVLFGVARNVARRFEHRAVQRDGRGRDM